jgi:hypothetical protein
MKHSNHAQHFIGVVTYYGEYLPNTEPHVFASNEVEAHAKCLDWCKGMNPAQLSIVVYPYINGYSN